MAGAGGGRPAAACIRPPPHSGHYHANRGHAGMSAVVSSDKLVPGQGWDGVGSSGKATKSKSCKIVSVKAGEGLHVFGLSSSPRARTDTSRDRDTCYVAPESPGDQPQARNCVNTIMAANFLR